jgi:hypothetical protein
LPFSAELPGGHPVVGGDKAPAGPDLPSRCGDLAIQSFHAPRDLRVRHKGRQIRANVRSLTVQPCRTGLQSYARLESHYTPKHASWLNMVEIEIGVLRGQCLDRRIDNPKRLVCEIAAWERLRNAVRARIKWMFTTDKARAKMGHAYPDTPKES